MFPNHFFHPDHVEPKPELVPALVEMSHSSVSQMLVELRTLVREVLVWSVKPGDAGIQVKDVHLFQFFFEPFVKFLANALAMLPHLDVNGSFDAMTVGSSRFEDPGIGIANNLALLFTNEIGIVLQGVFYASSKLLDRGYVIFESDGGLFDIGRVDGKDGCCILRCGCPNVHL